VGSDGEISARYDGSGYGLLLIVVRGDPNLATAAEYDRSLVLKV